MVQLPLHWFKAIIATSVLNVKRFLGNHKIVFSIGPEYTKKIGTELFCRKSVEGLYMRLKNLTYVVVLADEQNFSRAAERLYISQPALSKIISSIETDIGVALFDRSFNPVRLTKAGEIYVRVAREILNKEEGMYREIRDLNENMAGELKIGCTIPVSNSIMPQVLPEFLRRYPQVSVRLVEGHSGENISKLIKGELDVAVGGRNPHLPKVETIALAHSHLLAIMPKGYVDGFSRDMPIEEFMDCLLKGDYQYVLYPHGTPAREVAALFFDRFKLEARVVAETRMPMTTLRLIAQGTGMGFMPSYAYMQLQVTGSFKDMFDIYILPDEYGTDLHIHYQKDTYQTKALRYFMKIFKEEYKKLEL